jgi:hypothetical protein
MNDDRTEFNEHLSAASEVIRKDTPNTWAQYISLITQIMLKKSGYKLYMLLLMVCHKQKGVTFLA